MKTKEDRIITAMMVLTVVAIVVCVLMFSTI